jgi:hypothetical protein
MPGSREIPNYEPSDEGWGIVTGRLVRPKPEDEPDAPRDYIVLVGEPMSWDEFLALPDDDEQPEDAVENDVAEYPSTEQGE